MKTYIVIDLEWNQGASGKELPDMPFEIIEIGAVKLDHQRNEIDRFHSLIHPQVYQSMHYMNARVIHIHTEDLRFADDFQTVMKKFLKWCGDEDERIFCTWGDMDLTELQRNIRHFQMPPLSSDPIPFLDIQKLFSLAKEDGKSRRTLEYAVDYLGIRKNIDFHRALSDAWYTGEVFRKIDDPRLLERYSFNVFHTPSDRDHEIHVKFDDYSKDISRSFSDKFKLLADEELRTVYCHLCGKKTKRKIQWFSLNGKHYLCLASCKEHDLLRSKIRVKKDEDGGVYAVKTTRSISEEDAEALYQKAQKAMKKTRRQKSNLSNSE